MTGLYQFGSGAGWLPRAAERAAAKHGAELVNHTDPQCSCGYGCAAYQCRASRRHWFTGPNYGEPHDSRLADRVLSDPVIAAAIARRR